VTVPTTRDPLVRAASTALSVALRVTGSADVKFALSFYHSPR